MPLLPITSNILQNGIECIQLHVQIKDGQVNKVNKHVSESTVVLSM